MRRLMIFMMIVIPFVAEAQGKEERDVIAEFAGVTDIQDMDSYEVERLSDILRNPIKINTVSFERMEKSGMFTPFQIASIVDYRSRHGDILSLMELSSLDGFSSDIVSRLAPFITLGRASSAVGDKVRPLNHDVSVRTGVRTDDGHSFMYGTRCRVRTRTMTVSFSGSRSYSDQGYVPSNLSGNISWNHSSGNLIVGDFNARFGQGICLWNTSVLGGLTAPSAFMRKPSGVSPTFSFTGSSALTGLAGDVSFGRWKVSALTAFSRIKTIAKKPEGLMLVPAVNLTRYMKFGHVALTHLAEISDFYRETFRIPRMVTSADMSLCINGVNIFGEVAYDWVNNTVGTVGGTDWRVAEMLRMAALLKFYPDRGFSNEYGAAYSCEYDLGRSSGNFSVDASYYPVSKTKDGTRSVQCKIQANWDYAMWECLVLKIRISERLRTWGNMTRTDVRIDLKYSEEPFHAACRFNILNCVNTAVLGYCEGGCVLSKISFNIRSGLFCIDDWDDRIYVYEHDAPGSYNVPAYYGRGFWLAMNLSWKINETMRIYARTSYVGYPFMMPEKRKPGRAELKIQTVFKF